MLNLGMTEILCFAIIALLVLGPEKLPEAARFVAKWFGKLKCFVSNIQNEIDRELRLSEFRDEMQTEINRITKLEARIQKQFEQLQHHRESQIEAKSIAILMTSKNQKYTYCPHLDLIPFQTWNIHKSSALTLTKNDVNLSSVQLKIAV